MVRIKVWAKAQFKKRECMAKVLLLFCTIFLMGFSQIPTGVIHSCKQAGVVALTFDDGITNSSSRILDILANYQVQASFFLIGETLPTHYSILKRSYDGGHTIGNHTWSHQFLTRLDDVSLDFEILTTQNGFLSLNAIPIKRYLRPPYGAINQNVYDKLATMGFTVVLWNMDLMDWKAHRSKEKIWASFQHQLNNANPAKDSFILLLHTKEKTADLLPGIISAFKAKNFQLVSLEKCLTPKIFIPYVTSPLHY